MKRNELLNTIVGLLIIFCLCAYFENVLADQLVAYWPLDGTAEDASGNGHDGVLHGGNWDAGVVGQGLQLTESGQYLEISGENLNKFASPSFTITLWIRVDSWNDTWNCAVSFGGEDKGWALKREYNKSIWRFIHRGNPEQDWGTNGPAVSFGKWSHLAVTWDDAQKELKWYHDGDLFSVRQMPSHSMAYDTQWPIIIGATSQGTPHQFLTGQSGEVWVDEVRIYDYALNQFEVAKLSKPISSRICIEKIIGDLNNDCKVDLNDFILLSDSWLKDKSVDLALLEPIPLAAVDINDSFWTPKLQTYYNVTIDDVFTKFENDRGGAFNNFDRVFNGQSGYHAGPEWYDGLLYETIRGASDMLITHYSHTLEDRLDAYIARIARAAAVSGDGYINTWTQLMEPDHRWGENGGFERGQHDVYNAGALVEAGIHHYYATGKTELLTVAVNMANLMCDYMGPPPKHNIIPSHELPEEAFVKLYLLFEENPDLSNQIPAPVRPADYFSLSEFWIKNRGNHCGLPDWENWSFQACVDWIRNKNYGDGRPSWGAYAQDHKSVFEQDEILGHAVRAGLLCTGICAAAVVNIDEDYFQAANRLWESAVHRKMYITGSVGSLSQDEAFGPDYYLPNNGYLETCGTIAMGFFHHYMNMALGDAKYIDELERDLYNGILGHISLEGTSYYYFNPLESSNDARWNWHVCPCCPPMFLKIIGALPSYIYACDKKEDSLYVNLFIGGNSRFNIHGTSVVITQQTNYPWQGDVRIELLPDEPVELGVNIRIPGWVQGIENPGGLYYSNGSSQAVAVRINNEPLSDLNIEKGYCRIRRIWSPGDKIELTLPMEVRRIHAHPNVAADAGRIAFMRGPIVYCLESIDQPVPLRTYYFPATVNLTPEWRPGLLNGVMVLTGQAPVKTSSGSQMNTVTAVPFYARANRQVQDLVVWLPTSPELAAAFDPYQLFTPSASHCWRNDTVHALNDGIEPKSSADDSISRFTWWDHKGTAEWVQYDLNTVRSISSSSVYWWNDTVSGGQCHVPVFWKLLYRSNGHWLPVPNPSGYETGSNLYNTVDFTPVITDAIRIEVQLQTEFSGGILEWKVQ